MRDPLYNPSNRVSRRPAGLIWAAAIVALTVAIILLLRSMSAVVTPSVGANSPAIDRSEAPESETVEDVPPRATLMRLASDQRNGIVIGNPDGDLTLVEFFDYNCEYCRDVAKHVRELVRTDSNLRLVLRGFPLHGAPSIEAAQVTWAVSRVAGAQRAFEFHTRLMDTRGLLDGPRALAVAAHMGFDALRLQQLTTDDVVQQAVAHNLRLAQRLELTGTPAFVVGGEIILGAVGVDRLRSAIANARTCGSTHC